mgnify:CR=1 FL=1
MERVSKTLFDHDLPNGDSIRMRVEYHPIWGLNSYVVTLYTSNGQVVSKDGLCLDAAIELWNSTVRYANNK